MLGSCSAPYIALLLLVALVAPTPVQTLHMGKAVLAAAPHPALPPVVLPTKSLPAARQPLPRIVCPEGHEAFVYVAGLSSPSDLAFDPNGILHVAEERAGRVSRLGSDGTIKPVVTGLDLPEGIAFDPAGNLYVVEDKKNGRLLRITPSGGQTVLANTLAGPESVVWSPDDHLYVTESNVQFAENLPWDVVTGVSRVSQDGAVTRILTDTLLWSYSAITMGADNQLYVANEASNVATTESIFRVDPATGERTLFASDLTTPEGLSFSPGGIFPFYATEEDLGNERGRLSLVHADGSFTPLCTGFHKVEDVTVDSAGNVYVTEDINGLIVQIRVPDIRAPGPPQMLTADPSTWTVDNAFTLTWQNPVDPSTIAGAYVKIGEPPAFANDGSYYAGRDLAVVPDLTVPGPGTYDAHVWLEDGAGNVDHASAATVTLHYDPDPPGSPVDLSIEPSDWSLANNFTLSWTNPPEASGVMTAFYRIGKQPNDVEDYDGNGTQAGLNALKDVLATGSGEQSLYLWLGDVAGNAEPSTATSVTLHYDGLAPESSASAPAATDTTPIRVDWVASDAHSGLEIVHLWVKVGEEGTWTDTGRTFRNKDGSSAASESKGFFLYEPQGEGTYFFATRAVDRAGNAEAEPSGDGNTRVLNRTWQRVHLPLLWRDQP